MQYRKNGIRLGQPLQHGMTEHQIVRFMQLAKQFLPGCLNESGRLAGFAEAFAEYLHAEVRRELWGYAADETLTNDDMIAEKYRGIRPAPGYPSQPDHTEKKTLFDLLGATEKAGIELTSSYAMNPPASVSGMYFSHPDAVYFAVGRIEKDQVEDYARRKGWDVKTAERWLAPILNYEA